MTAAERLQTVARRAVLAVIGCLLALVFIATLALSGIFLLLRALIVALVPVVGDAAALALAGTACFVLIGGGCLILARRWKTPSHRAGNPSSERPGLPRHLKTVIQEHPLESALAAFAFGLMEQTNPHLRYLLLQSAMEFMQPIETSGSDENGVR